MTSSLSLSLPITYAINAAITQPERPSLDRYFFSYPIDIQSFLTFFVEIESTRALLEKALNPESEKIAIIFDNTIKSRAQLNFRTHTIVLNDALLGIGKDPTKSKASTISALIFELCNCIRKEKFSSLEKTAKDYSQDQFVEEWEKTEHESVLDANSIITKLGSEKRLPAGSPLTLVSKKFSDHYRLQQLSNHSQAIALKHQALVKESDPAYKGTWKNPVREDEKAYLKAYLTFKAQAEMDDKIIKEKASGSMQKFRDLCKASNQDLHKRLLKHVQDIES